MKAHRDKIELLSRAFWKGRLAELDSVVAGKKSAAEFLGLGPSDVPGLLGFAATLVDEKDLAGAEATAELATCVDPTAFGAWMLLAQVRVRLSEEERALEAYARAAQLDPKDVRLWCDVGELKLILLDYAGAAKALKLAIDADPGAETPAGRRAQFLVARTYAKLGARP